MAQHKTDVSTLTARERDLREKLKKIRARRREIERAELEQRLQRVVELAERYHLDLISPTILASEFKRLAELHASDSPARETDEIEKVPSNPAAPPAADGDHGEASTGDQPALRNRWFGGGA